MTIKNFFDVKIGGKVKRQSTKAFSMPPNYKFEFLFAGFYNMKMMVLICMMAHGLAQSVAFGDDVQEIFLAFAGCEILARLIDFKFTQGKLHRFKAIVVTCCVVAGYVLIGSTGYWAERNQGQSAENKTVWGNTVGAAG